MLRSTILRISLIALLLAPFIMPQTVHLSATSAAQSTNLKLVGPNRDPNPVVNEGRQLQLSVVDANGQAVSGVTFESGSREIARVDAQTGMVTGVERGFATITARRGNESISAFLAVARISPSKGVKVTG